MRWDDLKPNRLVADGRTVLKISTVYPSMVTAQLVFPPPPHTTVRTYLADEVARWREPSDAMVARYEEAWGFRS